MNVVTISGSHGAGKDTMIDSAISQLEKEFPGQVAKGLYAVTRKLRGKEKDGVDLIYMTPEEFKRKKDAGELFYFDTIRDYLVGSPREEYKKAKYVISNLAEAGIPKLKEWVKSEGGESLSIYLTAPRSSRHSRISLRESILIPEIVDDRLDHDISSEYPKHPEDYDEIIENPEGFAEQTKEKIINSIRDFIESNEKT